MIHKNIEHILQNTLNRYPLLYSAEKNIKNAYVVLATCYINSRKLLICGNGGSAADAEHIVGELMKSFAYPRKLSNDVKEKLMTVSEDAGAYLGQKLQPALRAIALTSHPALSTAFANDVDPSLVFAQQVLGYGDKNDVLLGISTSGNSANVVHAAITAKALGLKVIGLTGKTGGQLKDYCDVAICVDQTDTAEIQELHLPVYHTLCKMLELEFFG